MHLPALFVATWALLAVGLFGLAAALWIRRHVAGLRGKRLPPMRLL